MEAKEKVIALWKEEGETPLACIGRARKEGKIPHDAKATYAGRLDPMAEGLLLVLCGDAVHEKERYLKLQKEYEVEVLFGVSTDTGDILGLVENVKDLLFLSKKFSNGSFKNAIATCVGTFAEEYPKYSSPRLAKLFQPKTHIVTIHSSVLQNTRIVMMQDIAHEALVRIEKVKGNFRQEKIKKKWTDVAQKNPDAELLLATVTVSCESGAYMRVLAEKIGQKLDCPALAYRIKRTKIGNFSINT